jgi:SAM-dependent methyltransferase
MLSQEAIDRSRRTIASYEGFAAEYNDLVGPAPSADEEAGLRRLMEVVGPGGSILEIGSGPGRDADFLESLGAVVRRTDATRRFLELQAERGKHGDLLNVLTDELGGPYRGVLALCVLIHIERQHIDGVLGRIAAALEPGGAFLVSMREGAGVTDGDYLTTYWEGPEFAARLAAAGLRVAWQNHHVDSGDDPWLTFLAVRPA